MHIRPKQIGTNLWLKILLPRNEKGSYILICYPAQTNIKHLHVIGNRIWGVSTRAVCDSFCYVLQAKLQKLWKAQNITCKQLIIQKRTNSRKFFVNMYMKNWQQNYRNSERFKYSKQTTVSTVNALSLTHALFKYVYENWQPSLVGYLILRAQRRSYDVNEYERKHRSIYTSSLQICYWSNCNDIRCNTPHNR